MSLFCEIFLIFRSLNYYINKHKKAIKFRFLLFPIADIAEDLIILILGENLQYNVPIVPEVPI